MDPASFSAFKFQLINLLVIEFPYSSLLVFAFNFNIIVLQINSKQGIRNFFQQKNRLAAASLIENI
ncbi:hypothetical protein EFM10_06855 [Lactobacillus helveticus]|nr:hypothetical protein [Lactobacillus helveticus]